MRARKLAWTVFVWSACALGQTRAPAEVVDAFHAAMRGNNEAAALALLDPGLVVFELGSVDSSRDAYAAHHLRADMELAASTQWTLRTRRVGGEADERWVLSRYRVTGTQPNGKALDLTMAETAILRRSGNAYRIVHLHWSTRDTAFRR